VVPEECWFTVDRRINPEESLEEERAKLIASWRVASAKASLWNGRFCKKGDPRRGVRRSRSGKRWLAA